MDTMSRRIAPQTIKTNGFGGLPAEREASQLRAGRMESYAALAGGAMHEMSNLLATVLMSVDVLRSDCQAPAERDVLASLEEVARRGLGVTRQLQWLATGMNSEKTLFQPRFLISDLQTLVSSVFPRSVTVMSDYPPDLWMLEGDPLLLYQSLLDLLLAARETMAGGGTIALAARNERLDGGPCGDGPAGAFVVFEVTARQADAPAALGGAANGGNSAAARPPAPPASPALSRVGWEALRTKGVFLEPETSRSGCDRRLYLPAVVTEALLDLEDRSGETQQGAGELILIADDERILSDMLAAVLEQHGYQALTLREVGARDERLLEVAAVLTTPEAADRAHALLPARLSVLPLPRVLMMGTEPERGRTSVSLRKPFSTAQLLTSLARVLAADRPVTH